MLCPSANCQPGAILLGIVERDGQVSLATERIAVDEQFVKIAQQGRTPEKRFRFADKCIQSGCKQWIGEHCGVIDNVIKTIGDAPASPKLPQCSIRSQCRWYEQRGRAACFVCPLVITNLIVERETTLGNPI